MTARVGAFKPAFPSILFERNPQPMWVYDRRTLRFLDVNRAALQLYGYTRAEFLKLRLGALVHRSEQAAFKKVVGRLGSGLEDVGVRRHISKSGADVISHIHTEAVAFHGVPARLSILSDISKSVEASAWLESLFQSSREPIMSADSRGRVLRANPAYERLTGYTEAEMKGRPLRNFSAAEHRKTADTALAALRKGAPGAFIQKDYVRKDGTRVPVEVSAFPVKDRDRPLGFAAVVRDLSENRRLEQRYLDLYDRAPVMLHSIDREGRLIAVSDAWLKALGYERKEVLGRRSTDFLTPKSRVFARDWVLPAFYKTGSCSNVPYQMVKKDGDIIQVLLSATAERDAKGRVERSLAIMNDVTETNETKAWYESLVASSRDSIQSVDREGRMLDFNPAYERLTGYSRAELLKMRFQDITPPEYLPVDEAAYRRLLSGESSVEFEKEYLRRDGTRVPVHLTTFQVRDREGRALGYAAIIKDITERRRLEKEISETSAREQAKLGRDLHDSIGQTITAIALGAKSLRGLVSKPDETAREAERLESLSRLAIQQVRGLARGLLPHELSAGDLGASLRALSEGARQLFGVSCTVSARGDTQLSDKAAGVQLYRIAQEAVYNAAKHARSKRGVSISLEAGARRLKLVVRDDGVGIPARRPKGVGLGIAIMNHRAASLGGSLSVRRAEGGGTEVICECPRPKASL